jgi:hypothetical protein
VAEHNARRPGRFALAYRLRWYGPRNRRPAACEWCGRPIAQPETGRPRLYCRPSCRQRAYERRRAARAVDAVAQERDRALRRLQPFLELAEELGPFAYSTPDSFPPDPARLAIEIVELALIGR